HGLAQAPAIGQRLGQPVDMVDAQSIHLPAVVEPQRQLVYRPEHLGVFDAKPDQAAYLEKAAPVDAVRRTAPSAQAVMLPLEQLMQPPPTRLRRHVVLGQYLRRSPAAA